MTSLVTKYVWNNLVLDKILKEKLENKFGTEDPYFEQVPATRLNGKPNGKFKKVRKALPPGISKHDADILTKVKRRAYRLDMSFGTFLGANIGWGSLIGLVPVAGDVVDALLALMVVRTAKQVEGGLPSSVLVPMYIWVFIDFIAGLVPFVGDFLDALILANTRNVVSLENHLRKKGEKNLRKSGLPIPDVDPSDPAEFDRFNAESSTGEATKRTAGGARVPAADNHVPQSSGVSTPPAQPPRPTPAKVHDKNQAGSGKGIFGFGKKKSRPADVEAGTAGQGTSRK
ncbi:hypothetical protein F4778DRAFT_739616 [Xylariomycetidae sp. FL2044]|nr:hypothetical protein F4778DRAFT_739616 [Xylariomycetidae sp. FL2044]